MAPSTKQYADSVYEQARMESAAALDRELRNYRLQRSKTQGEGQLFSGPDYQAQVKIYADGIERCVAARLDSYKRAYGEINRLPTTSELREILNDFKATWELEIKHSTQALSRFLATRNAPAGLDVSATLRASSAHGHDRVLREWKIWRDKVKLQGSMPTPPTNAQKNVHASTVVTSPDEQSNEQSGPKPSQASSSMASRKVLSRSSIEAYVGIIGGLGYSAFTALGFSVNFWLGLLLWASAVFCLVDLTWHSPRMIGTRPPTKILLTVAISGLTALLLLKGWANTHPKKQESEAHTQTDKLHSDAHDGSTPSSPETTKSPIEGVAKVQPDTPQKAPPGKVPMTQARMRILDVVALPMSQTGASYPAITIYYDNAGTGVVTGVVNRFAAGFGGPLTDKATLLEQDKLLQWDGWKSEMGRRRQYEMHPGDPGEFTSIPDMEGTLAEQVRANFDKVASGTSVLHIFITFKYLDPSGAVEVTENCFWFYGNFARHTCGRGRTFTE